ncbi:hypothetical protein Lal_00022065 [Lupinus albus]|nr:hypothetical protein Lal_00022065 [Lupinus albus]
MTEVQPLNQKAKSRRISPSWRLIIQTMKRNIHSSSSCLNYITLGNKVSTLSFELNKMNKSSKSLSKIINDQRHSTDRRGLGYGKSSAPKKQRCLGNRLPTCCNRLLRAVVSVFKFLSERVSLQTDLFHSKRNLHFPRGVMVD